MKLGNFAPIRYVKTVFEEAMKVIWPTKQEIFQHTLVVVVAIVVAGMIFALIDFGFQKIVIIALSGLTPLR